MRRFAALLAAVLLLAAMTAGVLAAENTAACANRIQSHAAVATDGSCTVTLTVEFRLDQPVENMTFPLPRNAKGITVNSSSARLSRNSEATVVKLDHLIGHLPGTFTIMFTYSLSGCVAYDEAGNLMLTLPLLSGFEYPVKGLEFTVALPGEITTEPSFSSGYHKTSIESILDFGVDGTSIYGSLTGQLKDRETLTMTMPVTETMFPQEVVPEWTAGLDDVILYVCMAVAFLYWLVFLRCLPPRRTTTPLAPGGVTAGELGSVLTGAGADLTMMVLSWAQLGYILIHLDRHGRVFLHKRMEMGNERTPFENRVFQTLFGKKQMVDGTGRHYALLYRKVEKTLPNGNEYFRHSQSVVKLQRFLSCVAGLMGGVSLGLAIGGGSFFSRLLALVLGAAGAVSAWHIQASAMNLHLRDRLALRIGLACCAAWLLLGALAGEITNALMVVAFQLLTGLGSAYGGRRTEVGRQAMSQVLGLRRYLRKVNRAELQRICRNDPEYFFTQAPYAMALGVEQGFAKRFGPGRLTACPYLTTGMDGHLTASEWCALMTRAVNALDERQKRMKYERYLRR